MTAPSFSTKYSRFAPIFTAMGAFATVLPLPVWIGAVFGIAYLAGNGWILGKRAFPGEPAAWRLLLGAFGVWAAVVVTATLAYYLHDLGPATAFFSTAIAPALLFAVPRREARTKIRLSERARERRDDADVGAGRTIATVVLVAIIAFLALRGFSLIHVAATESLRSPWEVVPGTFLGIIGVIAALSLAAAYGGLGVAGTVGLAALAALATSVAASSYGIGFGFDPFIHRATESVILAHGVIQPKPFYYVGQYATVTLAARMLGTGTDAIDLRLMAVLFAAVAPLVAWGLRRGFGWRMRTAVPAAFLLLLLPLASFASTTPQGLANALFLAVAATGIAFTAGAAPWWYPVLLAVATACIHPLAGVPTLAFVALLLAASVPNGAHGRTRMRTSLLVVLTAGASIVLPMMFLVNAALSGNAGVTFNVGAIFSLDALRTAFHASTVGTRRFLPFLDLTYAWRAVRTPAFVIAALFGLAAMRRDHAAAARTIGLASLAFFLNYLLLTVAVDFPFLIDYERANYADRMADLTLFALLPAAAYAAGIALDRLRRVGAPIVAVGGVALVAVLTASSVYLAYPRDDAFETGRGWSTGAADIAAVHAIQEDADGKPYVVLANQSVSAAAIRELGFETYYDSRDPDAPGPVFFYPVPTGGPLYAIFLDANGAFGDRKTVERAMDLAGVDRVYYVVNRYWWDAQRIVAHAKTEADDWTSGDGTWTFRYDR